MASQKSNCMTKTTRQQLILIKSKTGKMTEVLMAMAIALVLVLAALTPAVESGGKGNKGKGGNQEDIIMYNGNIVMRGDESGGSIVMAGMHPTHEEVEFSPSFFTGDSGAGEMGGFGRRRRRR